MKMLLATDGSEHSEEAAKFLKRLNLSEKDEVRVLHVISPIPYKEDRESYYLSLSKLIHEIAPRIIETTTDIFKDAPAKLSSLTIGGYPDKGITDIARDFDTDLIVMGARGLKGIKALLIGSVTRSVAINSPKSVLVIKPPQWAASGNLKILFATDGSDYAKQTAKLLTALPFHPGTEITLLHVIRSGVDIPERFRMEIDERVKEIAVGIKSAAFRRSAGIIEETRGLLSRTFTKIEALTKDGDPTIEILEAAKMLNTDIIAVGSKGMRGIKGMLGSVSRYVLSRAECSVLIGKSE